MAIDIQENLQKIVENPPAHRSLLALLARLEYVGARKIAKSLPAWHMGVQQLDHWSEEVGHARLLQKQAEALSFADDVDPALLREGEAYLQNLDRGIAERLKTTRGAYEPYMTYQLVSLIVEERAMKFYPRYHHVLPEGAVKNAIHAIIGEEVGHLEEMREKCKDVFAGDPNLLEECRFLESNLYQRHFLPLINKLAAHA